MTNQNNLPGEDYESRPDKDYTTKQKRNTLSMADRVPNGDPINDAIAEMQANQKAEKERLNEAAEIAKKEAQKAELDYLAARRELNRYTKRILVLLHMEYGGLLGMKEYMQWEKHEIIEAIMLDRIVANLDEEKENG